VGFAQGGWGVHFKNSITQKRDRGNFWKAAQLLADAGLEFIAERIRKDNWTIENFIA
jgi:hypothetical protein